MVADSAAPDGESSIKLPIAVQTARLLDYFSIVPDGDAARVLVLPANHGRWTLPMWRDSEQHPWQATDHVNRAIREKWGLKVTTLRCVCNRRNASGRRDCRIYEMETHGGVPRKAPGGGRWIDEKDLDELEFSEREHKLLLRTYFLELNSSAGESRSPWARPGWIAYAVSWMLDQLKRLDIRPTGPVEQLRTWTRACILRVPTTDGDVYLKALPPPTLLGEELTFELIASYAEHLPSHLAFDPQRRWGLIREPGTASADQDTTDLELTQSVQALARVQLASIHDTMRYLRMGATDRRLQTLFSNVDLLFGDTFALRPQRGKGLTYQEVRRLRESAPTLKSAIERLTKFRLPHTLETCISFRGDTVTQQTGSLFVDWSEASISHPFFALAISPVFTPEAQISESQPARVRDAYLEAWTHLLTPDRLLEAFELAELLAPLHCAVAVHQLGLPNAETQWESEVSIPYYLRVLLKRLK